MENIGWILEVLLAFSFMIAIHEGGHFLACRLLGVEVEEFCIGFPPRIVSRKWGKTLYSIGSIPLGGFCKPQGGDLSGQTAEEINAKAPVAGDFLYASWWKRVIIFLAGPWMNYISALFIAFFVLFVVGEKVPNEKPILGFVPPNSLAEQAGLQAGDEITKINNNPVTNFSLALEDMFKGMIDNPGKPALLTFKRGNQVKEVEFKGDLKKPDVEAGIYSYHPPILGTVHLMTPARKAGLKPGDKVLAINGKKVSEWGEVSYIIHNAASDDIQLEIERDGQSHQLTIKRSYNGIGKYIGIGPQVDDKDALTQTHSFNESLSLAWDWTGKASLGMLDGLGKLVTGKISLQQNIGGPISILRMMYQTASSGLEDFLKTVAMISLMLWMMNLLPLGIVDGGQIVLCFIEGIKRQPLSIKIQDVYQKAGLVLVGSLMLFAVFNDIWGWVLEKMHNQLH